MIYRVRLVLILWLMLNMFASAARAQPASEFAESPGSMESESGPSPGAELVMGKIPKIPFPQIPEILPLPGQPLDRFDHLAITLEAERLSGALKSEHEPTAFLARFSALVMPLMRDPKSGLTLQELETHLRRQNTAIYLLAVPNSLLPNNGNGKIKLCVAPFLEGSPDPDYWMYVVGDGPEAERAAKKTFQIRNDGENFDHLKDTGFLQLCTPPAAGGHPLK